MGTLSNRPDHRPAPQHFEPPSARELRAQAVQRLQAGLFGLAAIVLLVGLANIINDRARSSEAVVPTAAPAKADDRADPLADIGVVPAAAPSAAPQPSATPKN
ncbi:MAG: hypothetical protein ACKOW1_08355 [Novosphingobium sp.]